MSLLRKYIVSAAAAQKMAPEDRQKVLVVADPKAVIDRHVTFFVTVTVKNANPNGDPDNGGRPRQYPDQRGYITTGCIRFWIRRAVEQLYTFKMHVGHESGVALQGISEAADAILGVDDASAEGLREYISAQKKESKKNTGKPGRGKAKGKAPEPQGVPEAAIEVAAEAASTSKIVSDDLIRACDEYYWDDRVFGRVYVNPTNDRRTGPIQTEDLVSMHPVETVETTIANTMVSNYKEKANKKSNFGHYAVVQYGLYFGSGVVNPRHASKTGCTWEDFDAYLNATLAAWEMCQTARRMQVETEAIYVFLHGGMEPSARMKTLRELVQPQDAGMLPSDEVRTGPSDYRCPTYADIVTNLPEGVSLVVIK